jgi:hypothetical protein
VDNGTDELEISVTTTGLDEYFDLEYELQKERGAIVIGSEVPSSGKYVPMVRVSYEDWTFFTDDYKGDAKVYYVDERYPDRLYLPISLTGCTVKIDFNPKGSPANIDSFLSNNDIPEEYHETIAKYAIAQALRRDRRHNEAREYLNEYYVEERDARMEIASRQQKSYFDDYNMEITNPHRDTGNFVTENMVM